MPSPDDPPRDELIEHLLADNARQPHPDPVCLRCGLPIRLDDDSEFDGRLCVNCGVDCIESLVRDLVTAADRPATLRAIEAIIRLAP
jgi:hypothetical protein